MEDYKIVNNEKQRRYELHIDGQIAHLDYRFYKGDIALMHTYVPKPLEGKGIASALAKHSLDEARKNAQLVMVYCPFVGAFLKRHPEYNDIIDKKYV